MSVGSWTISKKTRMTSSSSSRCCAQYTIGTAPSYGSSTRRRTMSAFTGSTIKARRSATGFWLVEPTSISIPSSRILGFSSMRRPKIDFQATAMRSTSRSRGSPSTRVCASQSCHLGSSVPTFTLRCRYTRCATSVCARSSAGCATTVMLLASRYPGVYSVNSTTCTRGSLIQTSSSSSARAASEPLHWCCS